MDDIVVINNLTKRFSQITALDNFSIKLPKGKVIGMLGPNGSGKTTLIKILTNLSMQYEGEVLINGQKPGIETKKIVSYLPDCNFLSDSWTVNDAIEYFVDFFVDFDEQKARNLISQLGINFNQKIKTLSKGTKEKVHLVLVLSRNAELYIFDEPIAGVDPAARDLIFKLILENYNKNGTIFRFPAAENRRYADPFPKAWRTAAHSCHPVWQPDKEAWAVYQPEWEGAGP